MSTTTVQRIGNILLVAILVVMVPSEPLWAIGGRGGGGGGGVRGGGGGGARPAMARPAPRPAPAAPRPAAPRPAAPRPAAPSPAAPRPQVPAVSRPAARPASPVARPNPPQVGSPSAPARPNLPQVNRPAPQPGGTLPGGGGAKPALPGNRPISRPQRPTPLPGVTERPNLPAKPNLPNKPGTPTTLPGGIDRPAAKPLPGKPGGSIPDFGGIANRPGSRPALPNVDGKLPGKPDIANKLPGVVKPGEGKPGLGNLPGGVNRPGVNRPGIDRPGTLPAVKPGQLGDFLGVDNVRPNRRPPSWLNADRTQINNVNNNWNLAVGNSRNSLVGWNTLRPERGAYWNGWGNGVRNRWGQLPSRPWLNGYWWGSHSHSGGWWHYGYGNRPWRYWWTVPTWIGVSSWFNTWGYTPTEHYYYDYGTGGNVVYQDQRVLVDGQDVGSTTEVAQVAADLATVDPPENDDVAAKVEWMPLGTFALSTSEDDTELTRLLQLAVSQDGLISGTLYNTKTDQTLTVQGRVDKATQKVAMTCVNREDIVIETGLYNLTQAEAPIIIHFGEKSEPGLLVRLDEPKDDEPGADPSSTTPPVASPPAPTP